MVEFYRNNSQEVTGEGDAQKVFATVLSAIQQFVVETKTQYVPNPIDEELKEKIQQLNEERRQLREQLNLATDLGEIERIKGAYQSLLVFTFQNLKHFFFKL